MSEQENYEPPLVWKWKPDNNQAFGNINRPTAGAQQEKELQVGKHLPKLSVGCPKPLEACQGCSAADGRREGFACCLSASSSVQAAGLGASQELRG